MVAPREGITPRLITNPKKDVSILEENSLSGGKHSNDRFLPLGAKPQPGRCLTHYAKPPWKRKRAGHAHLAKPPNVNEGGRTGLNSKSNEGQPKGAAPLLDQPWHRRFLSFL
ncbi:hypothetical protein RRG08_015246 [Elysia crispata]|uniref:Uncharacterized protein n=1 Tax=Elysia crispata TaxID=231223 RepID=A0AAE0YZZ9_9GAST|nr:hypothetical protein RRG08_015246 [Elysia crispata]